MMIKAVVTSILFSSPSMLIYSLSGGILSFIVMCIMKKYRFGLPVVSMGGGIFHNIGQLITAGLVLGNANVLYYAPAHVQLCLPALPQRRLSVFLNHSANNCLFS